MWKTNFASDDALDEVYGNTDQPAADDLVWTSVPEEMDADDFLSWEWEQASEPDTTTVPEWEVSGWTPEGTTPEVAPATDEPETPAEATTETPIAEAEEDPEKILQDLLRETEVKTEEAQAKDEEIKAVVEKSSMPDDEKKELLSKLSEKDDIIREKDDMISEYQLRHKAQEDKIAQAITENENYRIDSLGNKKVLDKIQSDPEVQEFVSLKIRADNWDEASIQKLDTLLVDMMKSRGFDIQSLVESKKRAEKTALSNQSTPSYSNWEITFNDGTDWDALEAL